MSALLSVFPNGQSDGFILNFAFHKAATSKPDGSYTTRGPQTLNNLSSPAEVCFLCNVQTRTRLVLRLAALIEPPSKHSPGNTSLLTLSMCSAARTPANVTWVQLDAPTNSTARDMWATARVAPARRSFVVFHPPLEASAKRTAL